MEATRSKRPFVAPDLIEYGSLEKLTLVPPRPLGCLMAPGKMAMGGDACDKAAKS